MLRANSSSKLSFFSDDKGNDDEEWLMPKKRWQTLLVMVVGLVPLGVEVVDGVPTPGVIQERRICSA